MKETVHVSGHFCFSGHFLQCSGHKAAHFLPHYWFLEVEILASFIRLITRGSSRSLYTLTLVRRMNLVTVVTLQSLSELKTWFKMHMLVQISIPTTLMCILLGGHIKVNSDIVGLACVCCISLKFHWNRKQMVCKTMPLPHRSYHPRVNLPHHTASAPAYCSYWYLAILHVYRYPLLYNQHT